MHGVRLEPRELRGRVEPRELRGRDWPGLPDFLEFLVVPGGQGGRARIGQDEGGEQKDCQHWN